MFKELDFISRKNGYLDFASYLFEKYNNVDVNNFILNIKEEENVFLFEINGNEYLFKPCTKKHAIKELLASEMLEYVGYEHASYDLACINGEYGVITRYLKKEHCDYISGEELIRSYYEYIDPNVNKSKKGYEDRFNNLTDIWTILEIKYFSHPNKNNMIKNVMDGLVKQFMFDILICQWDGASYNWIIEESENAAKLFPIYDNEKMLDGLNVPYDCNYNLKVEEDYNSHQRTKNNYFLEIRKFLQYSDSKFVIEFKNLLESLTPTKLREIIIYIENNIGEKIDLKIKKEILEKYEYLHDELSKILEEELSRKR